MISLILQTSYLHGLKVEIAVNESVSSAITQQATSTNCTWLLLLFQPLTLMHHQLNGKLMSGQNYEAK
ncbi:hypothetical protein GOBAR_AA23358 [Gossypium barbadense]|uniref:Uncharacterized protein n=1 Tax=Gossypium barbadense TaxID=3634 RepID=A0A2P5X1T9_GOSBA|nr:hypothetical protein GOBAR_AA23358 [Gossypium barbadense]